MMSVWHWSPYFRNL